jgi:flagellar hook-associated protein FlgK
MGDLLNIGASAAELYRQALATVSNNIANLNSDGYSRQEISSRENNPVLQGVSYLGTGANSNGVTRAFDEFATSNIRVANSKMNEQAPIMQYTDRLIDLLGTEKGSLVAGINEFFSAVTQLSTNPTEEAFRQEFIGAIEFLAERSKAIGSELEQVNIEIEETLNTQLDEFNKLSESLSLVNRELAKTSLSKRPPPALLDQRDFLLLEMSKYVSMDVTIDGSERALVKLAGSSSNLTFVNALRSYNLNPRLSIVSGGPIAVIFDAYGKNLNVGEVRGGTVGGLLKFRDDIFEKLRDDLDILVTKMANSINNIHKNGLNNNGDVGNLVFDLSPKYVALNSTDGTDSTGIKVTAPAGTPDINIKAKWDGVKNEWTVIDLVNESRSIIQPNSRADRGFSYNGVSINVLKTLENAEEYIIKPSLRDIDNIKVLINKTDQIATADRLQIESAITNSKQVDPTILFSQRTTPLSGYVQFNTANNLGVAQTITTKTNTVEPSLFIPRDANGFTVSIQPPVDKDYQLQLFTSEFNHIIGTSALDPAFKAGLSNSKSIEEGTTYINNYLNLQGAAGYKDSAIKLGNFASNKMLSSGLPRQTNSTGGPLTLIQGTSLKLNGQNLPALTIANGATLSAKDIANWINAETGNTGVTAKAINEYSYSYSDFDITRQLSINGVQIVNGLTGVPATLDALANLINAQTVNTNVQATLDRRSDKIVISNIEANRGDNISFSSPVGGDATNFLGEGNGTFVGKVEYSGTNINFEFQNYGAGQGTAKDMSRLGLATTIVSNSPMDDDFLVYATGSITDLSIRYDTNKLVKKPEISIEQPFTLTFLSPTVVQIIDTTTNTILAKKNYAWPNGVLVNDVKVTFSEAPTTGDVFTIKPNTGAMGDNGTMNRLIKVRDIGVDGSLIPTQKYLSLISDIGNKHELATISSDALSAVKDDAVALLDATAGVTLDSEAADLIKYQQSFQAAAQVIKVARDMFDTLIAASR